MLLLLEPMALPMPSSAQRVAGKTSSDGVQRTALLPPGPGNPRNSEGDFVRLKSGRILFVYSRFTGGRGDDDAACLASRYSDDGGRSWSGKDEIVVSAGRPNGPLNNIMSVSLRRLPGGDIGLFYLRKNSDSDCRPLLRRSKDEGTTWAEPVECITDEVAYYVMNNDRVVILPSGRILLPVALHKGRNGRFISRGRAMCYLSDDGGRSWQRSRTVLELTDRPKDGTGLQEPGVVQLRDGRLMMLCRTDIGFQYVSYSWDRGNTWSPAVPTSIRSPRSPASFERIPRTGDLLLVWNDNPGPGQARTPLTTAISRNDGRTWERRRVLEGDPTGTYCYTAISFVNGRVLLAYCCTGGLETTQVTSFPLAWLYGDDSAAKQP
ncbi:MAG TPA: sialidase family protein [Armatimonadota bacterium]